MVLKQRPGPAPLGWSLVLISVFSNAAEQPLALPETTVVGQREPGYKAETVSGFNKTPLSPREVPQSVSVVTRQQMDDQGMVSVPDAMQQVTGVTLIANDTLSYQYLSRGYALGVMYDGVPSYNGMTPSNQFDLPLYERIEVLRGPSGLLQGAGEPGGVVNLVKKRPLDHFAANWALSAGSWDTYRREGDISGPLNDSGSLRGRLVLSSEDRQYFYDRTSSDKWLGMAALAYDLNPQTTLDISYSTQEQQVQAPWSGLPAYDVVDAKGHYRLLDVSRSTFHAPDWGRLSYDTHEWSASLEHRFDNEWVLKGAFNRREQYQNYKYAYASSGLAPLTDTLRYSSMQGAYNYTREGMDVFLSGPFALLGRTHNLLLGANAEVYNSRGRSGRGVGGSTTFDGLDDLPEPTIAYTSGRESETEQYGLYSRLNISLADPLTLVLGARTTTFRSRTRDVAPSNATDWRDGAEADQQISPYGGLLYELNPNITLYASYTDIFVPQTQLKADGSVLKPREGRQYEVGSKTEWLEGRLGLSLAWFNLRDENRAYADPAYPNDNYYLNAGEVESEGWELEVSGKPAAGLDLSAGYTRLETRYLQARENQGRTYSIQTPKDQLKLWSNYRFDEQSALAGFSVGLGVLANGATQSSRGWRDELVNSGYAVVNGRIGYQLDKQHSVDLHINNLLDRTYYASVGTPNIYNFYGEPRSFTLTLRGAY